MKQPSITLKRQTLPHWSAIAMALLVILNMNVGRLQAQLPTQGRALQQWSDAKYSMFIHYGLYSVAGGVWEGKPVRQGYSEQIFTFGVGFMDDYESLARRFDAKAYDADAIVALAQASGMRSIVLTAKHHDGFCLWRTQTTDYNSYDSAVARRDLLGEMAEACHRAGLGFGIYFSLIDWHYPYALPFTSHNADNITPEHHRYNMAQITELLTNYGRVDELWFDMGSLLPEQSKELYELVHHLQPQCMVSGRLGNDYADFSVMADNDLPTFTPILPWQAPVSFFRETWGYRSWQERGKVEDKVVEMIGKLVEVVAKGGKFLLNIGPKGDGSVVPFEEEVLRRMGHFTAQYGDAIYGTVGVGVLPSDSSVLVMRSHDGCMLYLFVPRKQMEIVWPNVLDPAVINQAVLIGNPNGHVEVRHDRLILVSAPDDYPYRVVRLSLRQPFAGWPESVNVNAHMLSPLYGHSAVDYYSGYKSIVGYHFNVPRNARWLELCYGANDKGRSLLLLSDDGTLQEIVLEGGVEVPISWDSDKVVIKPVGHALRRGLFGKEYPELTGRMIASEQWGEMPDHRPNRQSLYTLYRIECAERVVLPLKLTYMDGVLVYLDGEYLTGEGRRSAEQKPASLDLLLSLDKGVHHLVLKSYNAWQLPRYAAHSKPFETTLEPLPHALMYSLKIPIRPGLRSLSITPKSDRPTAPALLHNLRITTK